MSDNGMILLPKTEGASVDISYFPTKMQAVIFRNWDMIPAKKLADCLECTVSDIEAEALKMGLEPQTDVSGWNERGYISIIKANWHLLNYEQLLELLGWTEQRLSLVLKEEDFLDIKLGNKKPVCEKVVYSKLTDEQEKATKIIAELIKSRFKNSDNAKKPFDFFTSFDRIKADNNIAKADGKTVVTKDWAIKDNTCDSNVFASVERFKNNICKAFGISFCEKSDKNIELNFKDGFEEEYHEIYIEKDQIKIVASECTGIMRALTFLKDLALSEGALCFEQKAYKRKPVFKTRHIYSFCGLYNDAFDVDSNIFCPDELLNEYAETGVNGIWLQAVMYRLTEFPFAPEISEGWEKRLENLKIFADRALKFGIKIYLYINEPRAMSLEFFEKYPHLLGNQRGGYGCLCTSTKEVQDYLYNGIQKICSKVPYLGGFFTITRSENITNCYSLTTEMTCPRCKDRKNYEVIAEVNTIIAKAASSVNPNIKVIAWDWAWFPEFMDADDVERLIDRMPEGIILQSNRETELKTNVAGYKGSVQDYSVSVCGVSTQAHRQWKYARERGIGACAKLQINNSWECSTIPYVPVFDLLTQNIEALKTEGVEHLMLSWTLGGYPSPNIKIVSELFFEDVNQKGEVSYDRVYKALYGNNADKIKEATAIFSDAFKEFPFHIELLYLGPQNGGISNPLYLEPTGMSATMTCYAFDDLKSWRAIYPEDIVENQFGVLCSKWALGLERLKGIENLEISDMAHASYIQFKSSYNQIKFVRARNRYLENKNNEDKNIMLEILLDEISLAEKMLKLMQKNPSIGFEAANHYYYTQAGIKEKAINCKYLYNQLEEDN